MNDEQTSFKVTDRRLFNADGSPRDLAPEEVTDSSSSEPEPASKTTIAPETTPASPQPASPQPESPQPAPSEAQAGGETDATEEDEIPDAEDPAGFINFIMSIASNAASSLGMMEHPVTRKREVDLELAKHWIDILGMLQKRTSGNLVPQEEKMLEGLLADLRMQYVSLTSSTPKTSSAYTGSDIIGG